MSEFKHDLVDIDENGDIIIVGSKIIYNTDGLKTLVDWVKESEPFIKVEKVEYPNMKGALEIVENNKQFLKDSIGTMLYLGNDTYNSSQGVWICSGVSIKGNSVCHRSILPSNLTYITTAFSARKLIEGNWINSNEQFLAPNESHPNFNQFIYDSVIYSIFNNHSQQSSLRNVNYKNKLWKIPNHFFFMSKEEIKSLANDNNNDECYEDVMNEKDDERFVYKFIEANKNKFSKEALDVLEYAKDLVRKSFKYRKIFNDENSDYQTNNWDIGWYQIKGILKIYMKDELKSFREVYKKLSEKMIPMVYELGMLRK